MGRLPRSIRAIGPAYAVMLLLFSAIMFAPALMAADATWDQGSFTSIKSSSAACDHIFAVDKYQAQHFLVGPTRRTSVIHLRDKLADSDLGFFDGISFIGLYGPNGDVFVDREISVADQVYKAHLEGFLDRRVIYVQINVKMFDGEALVCSASADFSGFN